MSFAGNVLGALNTPIQQVLSNLISVVPKRRLGTITGYTTFEETGTDRLAVTRHPVEQGASITDHSYKQPAELVIDIGFSNSDAAAFFDPNYINTKYQELLDLQVSRDPVDVVTGKRLYKNMLITAIAQNTNNTNPQALSLIITLEQVIIVQTSTVNAPPAADQQYPEQTNSVTNRGAQQAIPKDWQAIWNPQ